MLSFVCSWLRSQVQPQPRLTAGSWQLQFAKSSVEIVQLQSTGTSLSETCILLAVPSVHLIGLTLLSELSQPSKNSKEFKVLVKFL